MCYYLFFFNFTFFANTSNPNQTLYVFKFKVVSEQKNEK